ncbi:hypothetical protein IV498_07000 [Paenarthrobacter sp. Z7-10]|nr:hypothetical protein [Paenarthrobacter sp. Z7-10]
MIPAGNPRAAAASMRRYSAAISLRETVQRLALSVGLQVGAAQALLPDRVQLAAGAGASLVSHLEAVFSEPVSVSLSVGPARANRKPVLQVFDRKGRSLAFVKVGDSPTASTHVLREAESLKVLGSRGFSQFEPPSLIHLGAWEGMTVLVMSALDTGPGARGIGLGRMRQRALEELGAAFEQQPVPLPQTPMWSRLRTDHAYLLDTQACAAYRNCLDRVESQFSERVLPVGAWHGDFSPWNMAQRKGKLQLWDWERFEQGVPAGMDGVHYALNRHVRTAGTNLETILAGLTLGAPALADRNDGDAVVVAAYLASITLRYLLGAQGPGGESIVAKSKLMLHAFDRVTSQWERTLLV